MKPLIDQYKKQINMQKTFTKEYMRDNCGCYNGNDYRQLNTCSFMQSDIITLEAILNSEIPLKDKYWFVCKKLATKEQNQQIAIAVAEIVLPIYEKRYPEDKRPREAIDAAKQFIAGHIGLEELRRKRAAYAAADADAASAYAAYAAYAASAYAAYAASAYAAYAASAYAAYAADAAAYAADISTSLLNYLIEFCNKSE